MSLPIEVLSDVNLPLLQDAMHVGRVLGRIVLTRFDGTEILFREAGLGKPSVGDWYLHKDIPVLCGNPAHVHDVAQLLEKVDL